MPRSDLSAQIPPASRLLTGVWWSRYSPAAPIGHSVRISLFFQRKSLEHWEIGLGRVSTEKPRGLDAIEPGGVMKRRKFVFFLAAPMVLAFVGFAGLPRLVQEPGRLLLSLTGC